MANDILKASDYDIIANYAKGMYDRNLRSLGGNILDVNDFIHEAYAKGFCDIDQAVRIIRDSIITEKRKVIGKIQQRGSKLSLYQKQCKECLATKSAAEFTPRLDKRTGYRYFDSHCKSCRNSEPRKKKKREAYALSATAKAKAHQRYLRYKPIHQK